MPLSKERNHDDTAVRTVYPSLGDERKRYPALLTEPEINAIGAAVGFLGGFFRQAGDQLGWWEHYRHALEGLSERLSVYDDGNAPFDPERTA